jgi:hypothetical protein
VLIILVKEVDNKTVILYTITIMKLLLYISLVSFLIVIAGCGWNPLAGNKPKPLVVDGVTFIPDGEGSYEPAKAPGAKERLWAAVRHLHWGVYLSIGTIIIGVITMMNGNKDADTWIVAGAIGLGLCLAVVKFAAVVAVIALLGAILWFGYSLFMPKGFLHLGKRRKEKPMD